MLIQCTAVQNKAEYCKRVSTAARRKSWPYLLHIPDLDFSNRFSTTERVQVLENVKGLIDNAKNSVYSRLGMQTPNEKELEGMIEQMRPKSAKGLLRQQRKRWGRPTTLIDSKTGESKERVLEHKYSTANFRISHRKLQLLADQIGGGKPIDYAILQMQFSQKRAARRIKSTLALARDHAVAKGLNLSKLVVAEAWVGKGRTFKRIEIKGRGRMGIRKSFQAKMSIVLREGKTWDEKQKEHLAKEKKKVRSIGTGGVVRTNVPVRNTFKRAGWQW